METLKAASWMRAGMRTPRSAALALAYWSGMAGRACREQGVARILRYHGTPRSKAAELERQLRYLKRHFTVVSLGELASALGGPAARFARKLVLTFDDGLRNNLEVAYPILQRLGLPATFFVCPGNIEHRKWLWTQEARQRMRFAAPGLRQELGVQLRAPVDPDGFVAWMKTLDPTALRAAEKALRDATRRYSPSPAEHHEYDIAGWEELRALDSALITIGSHTMTHAILPCLPANDIERELGESRRTIQDRLQQPADFFAYPNGDTNELAVRRVRTHYRAAVQDTVAWVGPFSDAHRLPRLAPPRGVLRLALKLHRGAGAGSTEDIDAACATPYR